MAKCNKDDPLESTWSMLTLCSTKVLARSSCLDLRARSRGSIPWSSSSFNLLDNCKKERKQDLKKADYSRKSSLKTFRIVWQRIFGKVWSGLEYVTESRKLVAQQPAEEATRLYFFFLSLSSALLSFGTFRKMGTKVSKGPTNNDDQVTNISPNKVLQDKIQQVTSTNQRPPSGTVHIVWKLLKMSHLNFWILAFSANFWSY